MPKISFLPNKAYPALPTIGEDLQSHSIALAAIRESIQTHERRTKNYFDSFVRLSELVDLGLISLDGATPGGGGQPVIVTPTEEAVGHSHDGTYLRLDGSNDPVTGHVVFNAGLDAGADITLDNDIAINWLDSIGASAEMLTLTTTGSSGAGVVHAITSVPGPVTDAIGATYQTPTGFTLDQTQLTEGNTYYLYARVNIITGQDTNKSQGFRIIDAQGALVGRESIWSQRNGLDGTWITYTHHFVADHSGTGLLEMQCKTTTGQFSAMWMQMFVMDISQLSAGDWYEDAVSSDQDWGVDVWGGNGCSVTIGDDTSDWIITCVAAAGFILGRRDDVYGISIDGADPTHLLGSAVSQNYTAGSSISFSTVLEAVPAGTVVAPMQMTGGTWGHNVEYMSIQAIRVQAFNDAQVAVSDDPTGKAPDSPSTAFDLETLSFTSSTATADWIFFGMSMQAPLAGSTFGLSRIVADVNSEGDVEIAGVFNPPAHPDGPTGTNTTMWSHNAISIDQGETVAADYKFVTGTLGGTGLGANQNITRSAFIGIPMQLAGTLAQTFHVGDPLFNTQVDGLAIEYTGPTTVSGTLDVTGATTLETTLDVEGATTLDTTLGVGGAVTLATTLGVTGLSSLADVDVDGDLDVGGTVTINDAGLTGNIVLSQDGTDFLVTGTSIGNFDLIDFTGGYAIDNLLILQSAAASGSGGDPYWANVVFVGTLEGVDEATSYTELSAYSHAMTFGGNAKIDNAQAHTGDTSLYVDGTGYIETPDFAFGTQDFTFEAWIRPSVCDIDNIMALGPSGGTQLGVYFPSTNTLSWQIGGSIKGDELSSITLNAWTHVCVERVGNDWTFYHDGVSIDTYNGADSLSTGQMSLGRREGSSNQMIGWIDNARLTLGAARYNGAFTPPTTMLLAGGDDDWASVKLLASFDGADAATTYTSIDAAARAATFVGDAQLDTAQSRYGTAAVLLDGTGDELTFPDSVDWELTGEFTIEYSVHYNGDPGTVQRCHIGHYDHNADERGWLIFGSNNYIRFGWSTDGLGGSYAEVATPWNPVGGQWYDIAITRDASNNLRFFVDGVLLSTQSVTATFHTAAAVLSIGSTPGSNYLNGWMDEVRFTKGVCRYTANYTPFAFPKEGPPVAGGVTLGDVSVPTTIDGLTIILDAATDITGALTVPNIALIDYVQFDTAYTDGQNEGRLQWNTEDGTLEFGLPGGNVNLQIGQEQVVRCRNTSGALIPNGSVIRIAGASGNKPLIELADASLSDESSHAFGYATEDIDDNSNGYVTVSGLVRDIDTSGMTEGDDLWLSETAGEFTNVRPVPPAQLIAIGHVISVHATTGVIFAIPDPSHRESDLDLLYMGIALDSPDVSVTSDGATVSLTLEGTGGGDIRFVFSTGTLLFDCTPIASVALTAGTDTSPTLNFIYVLESTGALTVSTSAWPAAEHAPIATVMCQSAASLQTDGAYKVHAWTDHVADSVKGHLGHLNYWIRSRPAGWLNGCLATVTAGAATFDLSTAQGTIIQLHEHSMPAFDTATGSEVMVINDSVTPYVRSGDLTGITLDAAGTSLANKYFNLVVWGVISEDTGDCQLMINLPTGVYTTESAAQTDDDATAFYDIPLQYVGVGFLIARLTMRLVGTTYTESLNTDLRGSFPSTAAGSSGGGGGGMENIVEDLTPQLGGILDANTFDIDMGTNVLTDAAVGNVLEELVVNANLLDAGRLTAIPDTEADALDLGVGFYYLDNAYASMPGGYYDASLITLRYDNDYSTQIAGDWESGKLWVRGNAEGWTAWEQVWDSSDFIQTDIDAWNGIRDGQIMLESAAPFVWFQETDASLDNKNWALDCNSEKFIFRIYNDAYSVNDTIFVVDRTAAAVDYFMTPTEFRVADGYPATDWMAMSHNGTDFTFDFVNTTTVDFTNAVQYEFDAHTVHTSALFTGNVTLNAANSILMTGSGNFVMGDGVSNMSQIVWKSGASVGGWARGMRFESSAAALHGGIGALGSNDTITSFGLGFGATWYSGTSGLSLTATNAYFDCNVYARQGHILGAFSTDNLEYVLMQHDGTNFNLTGYSTGALDVKSMNLRTIGGTFLVTNPAITKYVAMAHDETDFNITGTNTTDLNITGMNVRVVNDIGFYNTAPIAKQTGVAVSAAGIHAALVNLGLIT